MKTSENNPVSKAFWIGQNKAEISKNRFKDQQLIVPSEKGRVKTLIPHTILEDINKNNLPDLRRLCYELAGTFTAMNFPFNATQFIPTLSSFEFSKPEINLIKGHSSTRFILMENELIKIVLIRWKAGENCKIHGHPAGGCVFKVLSGELMEKRYSSLQSKRPICISQLKTGAMAYLDDRMGYHKVSNPSDDFTISLHVYTPGIKNYQ